MGNTGWPATSMMTFLALVFCIHGCTDELEPSTDADLTELADIQEAGDQDALEWTDPFLVGVLAPAAGRARGGDYVLDGLVVPAISPGVSRGGSLVLEHLSLLGSDRRSNP